MIALNPALERYFLVRIKRQDAPAQQPYWHEFRVPYKPGHNVISVLQYVAAHPTTTGGEEVEPPVWESGCLEEVCGSCTMLVNGHVRQACSALIDDLLGIETSGAAPGGRNQGTAEVRGTHFIQATVQGDSGETAIGELDDGDGHVGTVVLEPMSKFPTVRDLWVDRARMFDSLAQVKAWVPIDGTHDLGPGPRERPHLQEERYAFSRCMTCGCCLEACPQFQLEEDPDDWHKSFIGAQAIGQAHYFNLHETGKTLKGDRLEALMGPGGVTDCGNAQNCVKVCPKEIPLTEAIAKIGRQVTVHAVKKFFTGK